MARQRAPRVHLNPYLVRTVRTCGQPRWQLALLVGFGSNQQLSNLLHAEVIVATPLLVARVKRLAAVVGFADPVFSEDVR